MTKNIKPLLFVVLLAFLAACGTRTPQPSDDTLIIETSATPVPTSTAVPSPTLEPPRVLTVCMGAEPTSLFLYADKSAAARAVLQAVYDGPFDVVNGDVFPVIIEQVPSMANGDVEMRQVEVEAGNMIMDVRGNWVALESGVSYRPSGCTSVDCAQTYEGGEPANLDELVVRFHLIPGLLWADGTPLTADDSVYSFSVAQAFYGNTSDMLRFTQSYTAADQQTVEWVGIPGYQGPYATHFFSPLPQHLWAQMSIEELLVSETSTRTPMGWGPYRLDEWTPGDHISLSRNPNYYRAEEGLPHFDHLVYRFVEDGDAAIDALLVGECDYVDQTALGRDQASRLLAEQENDQIDFQVQPSAALEQAVFGIRPYDPARLNFFDIKEVRQAISLCIDRQRIIAELFLWRAAVPDGYLLPDHSLYNPDIPHYDFDPQAARELFATAGWVDYDQDTSTPLTSVGVPNVPDNTTFTFTYLVPNDAQHETVAQIVQASLAQCGVGVEIQSQAWATLLEPGPDAPVFGRGFDMAQFAWGASPTPPCFLYQSSEIPGPYPQYSKGWGGGNPSGYSNPEFDNACRTAMFSLPDVDEYQQAHAQAQAIFGEDLPVIPLYWHPKLAAGRPDMCGIASGADLISIESFNYGEGCGK
ncbi:MAG: ABC transporter substrate-binding protein [Chloroflexota bacterium]|nr:ABC transporter substrate-binding protein [Chloroflexota bacterium]